MLDIPLRVMLKIMKQAKNRPLRVIYLLLLCSTHCWAFSLEKWCGNLEIDTKYYYVRVLTDRRTLCIISLTSRSIIKVWTYSTSTGSPFLALCRRINAAGLPARIHVPCFVCEAGHPRPLVHNNIQRMCEFHQLSI